MKDAKPPKLSAKIPTSTAVEAFEAANMDEKNNRIKKIIDDAAALLEAENVKWFIGVVDRRADDPTGGKAFCKSDVTGEDFVHILDMALPTRQDAVNLGIYAGTLISARSKNKQP